MRHLFLSHAAPRTVATLGILLGSLTAAAPAGVGSAAPTVVRGTVRDPAGSPLAAAVVDLRVDEATQTRPLAVARTDSAGHYLLRVPDRVAGVVILRAWHAGFAASERRLALRADTVQGDLTLASLPPLSEQGATSAAGNAMRPTSPPVSPQLAPMDARSAGGLAGSTLRARVSGTRIADAAAGRYRRRLREPGNTEAYDHLDENDFRSPRVAARSTFSVDVDRASYGNVRRFLAAGTLPPADAVRIEELVNYFPYDDPAPRAGEAPLRLATEIAPAPWNASHDLVRIALRARDVDMRHAPASNLVFLIDVSGSMMGPGRLPLVKESLALLVEQLREEDRIAIVVYAGQAGLVLPSTPGTEKARILAALDGLQAGGSTAGGAGIRLAYDVARRHFVRGGTNRVILCTDGDFNVGPSSDGELVRLIEQRRGEGSFLTILGFGMGNYKDAKMEKLADAGNGNYAYIDDLLEARKMLVREMGGTFLTVAKDVKLQVEFNPARVQAYRLLGYEDRLLHDEDFTNDARDAGDVGAGHTVTALYEIVRTDVPLDVDLPDVPPLRYQQQDEPTSSSDELLHVAMRYKVPDGDRSTLVTLPVRAARRRNAPSESMRFASAVAGFGMLLRHSPNAGTLEWTDVIALARGARGEDEDGYRAEFVRLAERAALLSVPLAARLPQREPYRDYAVPARP